MTEQTGQWHPDPYGRAEMRWYDGTAWTQHVSTGGVTSQEPAEAPAPPAAPTGGPSYASAQPYAAAPAYGQPAAFAHPAYPVQPYSNAMVPDNGRGRLIAAGVMSIITGVLTAIVGIYLFSVANSEIGGIVDDLSGGAITVMAIVVLVFGGVFLWFGIAGVRVQAWSRLAMAIAAGLMTLLVLLGMISDPDAAGIVPLAWFGTILGLAVSYKPVARY